MFSAKLQFRINSHDDGWIAVEWVHGMVVSSQPERKEVSLLWFFSTNGIFLLLGISLWEGPLVASLDTTSTFLSTANDIVHCVYTKRGSYDYKKDILSHYQHLSNFNNVDFIVIYSKLRLLKFKTHHQTHNYANLWLVCPNFTKSWICFYSTLKA